MRISPTVKAELYQAVMQTRQMQVSSGIVVDGNGYRAWPDTARFLSAPCFRSGSVPQ